jgi:alanine racemase
VLQIDLAALQRNYRAIAEFVAPLRVMAVLKANAYGLGVRPIARALREVGATAFGVAELKEAEAIADLGCRVHVLGAVLADETDGVIAHGLEAPIADFETAQLLSEQAVKAQCLVSGQFLIDSGMGRLGIRLADAEEVIRRVRELPGLRLTGLYSHFPYAYGDEELSRKQVADVRSLVERLAAAGLEMRDLHIANSDGINNVPEAVQAPFTMVRTGINLYGVHDVAGEQALSLEPVLRLTARLAQVRTLPAGSTIGYGCSYTVSRTKRVGTVAIGYADGVPLSLSRRGSMVVRGRACKIIGRVSMDYVTIDLDEVPDAAAGDEVTCIGAEGLSVRDWAATARTIPYQIICAIGSRVQRRYG